jgi:hypothetical protein
MFELIGSGVQSSVYRRLAATNAAAYEPDLASSLSNLSVRLAEPGAPAAKVLPRSRKPSRCAVVAATRSPTNPTSRVR